MAARLMFFRHSSATRSFHHTHTTRPPRMAASRYLQVNLLLAAALLLCMSSISASPVAEDTLPEQPNRKLLQRPGFSAAFPDGFPGLASAGAAHLADIADGIRSRIQALFNQQDSSAAASAIAAAGSSGVGSSEAAAAATASVQQAGAGRAEAVAESFAAAAARNSAATAAVLARAAAEARSMGATQVFAPSQALAFAKARSSGCLRAFTSAVAEAISEAPDQDAVVETYGAAFAEAIAAGGEEGEALAQATAIAFCQGGGTATAFARAFNVAISRNEQGCVVLTKARALASAQCRDGVASSFAEASVESRTLGLCGEGFRG